VNNKLEITVLIDSLNKLLESNQATEKTEPLLLDLEKFINNIEQVNLEPKEVTDLIGIVLKVRKDTKTKAEFNSIRMDLAGKLLEWSNKNKKVSLYSMNGHKKNLSTESESSIDRHF
jgi:hypothetical protein